MPGSVRLAPAAFALFVLAVHAAAAGPEVSAGFSLTIEAPTTFTAGTPFPVSGALYAGAGLHYVELERGVAGQRIDIHVDDVIVATTTTGDDGAYALDLAFDARPPTTHTIRAVAFTGTPVQTSSRPVVTTIDRTVIDLRVSPATVTLQAGQSVALLAEGTFSDGRDEPVTEQAVWTTSDAGIATVSNAAGSRGMVTAVAPGTATITAELEGTQAAAEITVSA